MSDDDPAPGFAMQRAVEILAKIDATRRSRGGVAPVPLDRAVVLVNERLTFALGTTAKADVERAFGASCAYPLPGWHTYAAQEHGTRRLLSAFFRDGTLVGLEYYVPKTTAAPELPACDAGTFRLVPGDVVLGSPASALDRRYTPAVGGPAPLVYAAAFEARFPGGVVYVMANDGRIERFGLYAAT